MIKKQVLCSSVLLLSLMGFKVLKFQNSHEEEETPLAINWHLEEEKAEDEWRKAYIQSLHFAKEKLPIEDGVVKKRMMGHLKEFSRKKTQSHFSKQYKSSEMKTISDILSAHGIPSDFKYIPIIESGIDAEAASHKGAKGYWQFIPATARSYGLKVNQEVDERQDLVKSTHAAAKYIKTLYKQFGSWALVAAAFNTGDGNLKRAMGRQGGETNYFKLKLNKETSNYVYKLIAVKEVIERPNLYIQKQNEKTWYAWEQSSEIGNGKTGIL